MKTRQEHERILQQAKREVKTEGLAVAVLTARRDFVHRYTVRQLESELGRAMWPAFLRQHPAFIKASK